MKSAFLPASKSIFVVLMLLLFACVPPMEESPQTPVPARQKSTETPNLTPTFDEIAIIPAWTPADNFTGTPIARWVQYESAFLAACAPHAAPPSEKLCEWDIILKHDNTVYVWAFCIDSQGRGSSLPLAIYLNHDGMMEKVLCPRTFSESKALFPPDMFEQIYFYDFDLDKYWEHLELRFEDRSIPPLIVVEGTPLP